MLIFLLVTLALAQAWVAYKLTQKLETIEPIDSLPSYTPPAAVILCLRGSDPFLEETLLSVLEQDYPLFEFHIVVDSIHDPAWEVVERVKLEDTKSLIRTHILTERFTTCGLKCSALLQALHQLPPEIEVTAHLDADTVPHKLWLRQLVAPLADCSVGVTHGNRWFQPPPGQLGAMVRFLWNLCAVASMNFHNIPWGGTLALRVETFHELSLAERWSRAFCEDTLLTGALKQRGLKVEFVPELVMVSREGCSLRGFFIWMRRQLLTVRLYHSAWPVVLAHAVVTTATILLSVTRCLSSSAPGVAAALIFHLLVLAALGLWINHSVSSALLRRKIAERTWSLSDLALLLFAAPVTQLLYCAAALWAHLLRREVWRGAIYRIEGPWQINIVKENAAGRSQGQANLSL